MSNGDTTLSQEDLDALLKTSQAPGFEDHILGMEDDLISNLSQEQKSQAAPNSSQQATDKQSQTLTDTTTDTAIKELIDKEGNTELLKDITLRFTVVLGNTKMLIKDVIRLGEGSIVELERYENEGIDILVNDRLFGHGKLKVLGDYFGVQITEILSNLDSFRSSL